jgi:hypothetical protein
MTKTNYTRDVLEQRVREAQNMYDMIQEIRKKTAFFTLRIGTTHDTGYNFSSVLSFDIEPGSIGDNILENLGNNLVVALLNARDALDRNGTLLGPIT